MARLILSGPFIKNDDAWLYDWFGMDYVTPKKVDNFLKKAAGEDTEFLFNSPGGYLNVGVEIYTLLKGYEGKTTAQIVMAGSAASIAMLGCTERLITPSGQVFIHRTSAAIDGNTDDHTEAAKRLDQADEAVINTYELETNISREEIKTLMISETTFNADEAIEKGFCTGELFPKAAAEIPILNSADESLKLIEKIKGNEELFRTLRNQALGTGSKKAGNNCKNKNIKEATKMNPKNIEELRVLYPDIFNDFDSKNEAAKKAAVSEAIKSENARIAEIENIALPGFEDIVSEAKRDTSKTAQDVAMAIIAKQKDLGVRSFNALKADNGEVNGVPSGTNEGFGIDEDGEAVAKANAAQAFKNFVR